MSSTFIFSVMNMETKSVRDNVVFLIDLSVCQFVVRNDQWENADSFFFCSPFWTDSAAPESCDWVLRPDEKD